MKKFLSTFVIGAALALPAVASAQTLTPGFENWNTTDAFHTSNDITAIHNDSPQPWLSTDGTWQTDMANRQIFTPTDPKRSCAEWGMFPTAESSCTYQW